MLIMISRWFQSYFDIFFLGSSKIYAKYVLKAVFVDRNPSKPPLYVGQENCKSYKALYQKFSRRPPHIGFGPYKGKKWKKKQFWRQLKKNIYIYQKERNRNYIIHIIFYWDKPFRCYTCFVMFSKLILLFQMFYISCFYPRGSFAPQ